MAQAPLELRQYQAAIREKARDVAPQNAEEFSDVLVRDVARVEKLVDETSVPAEKLKQYKERIRNFIVTADPENFQKLSGDLHTQLEKLYAEMEQLPAKIEPPKPEDLEAKFEVPRVQVESFQSQLKVGDETFDVANADNIAPAATALQKVEMGFLQTGTELSRKFEEAKTEMDDAQKEAEDSSLIDWAAGLFSDSDEAENAKATAAELEQLYAKSLEQLQRQQVEITSASHRLLGAADSYLLRLEEGSGAFEESRDKLTHGKKSFSDAEKAAKDFLKRMGEDQTQASAEFEKAKTEFERKIQEIDDRIETLKKKRTDAEVRERELRADREKVEKELKKKDLDADDRKKYEADYGRLSREIGDVVRSYEEIDTSLKGLNEERGDLVQKRDEHEKKYGELVRQMDEQKSARETEIKTFQTNREQADAYAQQIESAEAAFDERKNNIRQLRTQMDDFFGQWRGGNEEMMNALNQQKVFLEHFDVAKPTFFNSLWNTPGLGKWGVLGLGTLIFRAPVIGLGYVDDMTGGFLSEKWKGFSDTLDQWAENSKEAGGFGAALAGLSSGTRDLFASVYHFVDEPGKALDGIASLVFHPSKLRDAGKMLIEYDEFSQGNTAYATGRVLPTILLTAVTGGSGSAVAATNAAKAGSVVARIGSRVTGYFAAGGSRVTVGSVGRALMKTAVVDLPRSVVRGSYRMVKGTGELLLTPFKMFQKTGRLVYGASRGMSGRELQMFTSYGRKGIVTYRGSLDDAIARIQTERADILKRVGAADEASVTDATALRELKLKAEEFASLDAERNVALQVEQRFAPKAAPQAAPSAPSAAPAVAPTVAPNRAALDAQLQGLNDCLGKIPAKGSIPQALIDEANGFLQKKIPQGKQISRKAFQRALETERVQVDGQIQQMNQAAQAAPAAPPVVPTAAPAATPSVAVAQKPGMLDVFSRYRAERSVLERRQEVLHRMICSTTDDAARTQYLGELANVEKDLYVLPWKYGKQGLNVVPGVQTLRNIAGGVRPLLKKALDAALVFGGTMKDALKAVLDFRLRDALQSFFGKNFQAVKKFFGLIVSSWSFFPQGMRELILMPNQSVSQKFVLLVQRYPVLGAAILDAPMISGEELEALLRQHVEANFAKDGEELLKKVSEGKFASPEGTSEDAPEGRPSFEDTIPQKIKPPEATNG